MDEICLEKHCSNCGQETGPECISVSNFRSMVNRGKDPGEIVAFIDPDLAQIIIGYLQLLFMMAECLGDSEPTPDSVESAYGKPKSNLGPLKCRNCDNVLQDGIDISIERKTR